MISPKSPKEILAPAGRKLMSDDTQIITVLSKRVIMVHEEKLQLHLVMHEKNFADRHGWVGPLAMFVSLLLVFATSAFKDAFTIPAGGWEGFFLFLCLASAIWTAITAKQAYGKKTSIQKVIEDLCSESNSGDQREETKPIPIKAG